MSITVQSLLSRVSDDIKQTISTSSDPTQAQVLRWYSQITNDFVQICANNRSEIGRFLASLSATDGVSTYRTYKDILHTPDKWGYILKTDSKPRIKLITEAESLGYGFATTQESEPSAFSVDAQNNFILHSTPDDSYTIKIPFWRKVTEVTALTYSVASASKADPCVVGITSHPFQTYDRIYIDSVVGMTELNGYFFDITRVATSTLSLDGIDSSAYTTWSSAGTVYPTVPFNGLFDNAIQQAMVIKIQNREEYNQEFETGWLGYLTSLIIGILDARKKTFSLKVKYS